MLALVLALLHVVPGVALSGVIRTADSAAPLAGAEVDVTSNHGGNWHAWSDSLGQYVVSSLAAGTYHVRVSRRGFRSRDADVTIAPGPGVVLDIALSADPVVLSTVRVTGAPPAFRSPHEPDSASLRDVGTRTVQRSALHANPAFAEPDALLALTTGGDVTSRPEGPTALHVLGGAGGESVVQLDGVPLFDPYHTTGTLTAIDPDVVSSVTLRAGAPGAEFGGATAGIVSITTANGDSTRLATRGGLTMTALREAAGGPLPLGLGTFVVSARGDRSPIVADRHSTAYAAHFADLFAKTTMPLAGGSLELLAFHSGDRLGFAAGEAGTADGPAGVVLPPDALRWLTGTDAIRWRGGAAHAWDVRAWRTHFDAGIEWAASSRLASSLDDIGAAVSGGWHVGAAQLAAGVTADRYDVRYQVSPLVGAGSGVPDSLGRLLALHGSPMIAAAFVEGRWRAGAHWSGALGLREESADGAFRVPEPRFSLHYAPTPRLSLGLGVARLYQDVQSLRNEESPLDAIAGITLPVIAGSAGPAGTARVPAVRADQAIATIAWRVTPGASLALAAFTRAESGVALVAPVTMQPFAMEGFDVGTTHAMGASLALTHEGQWLSVELGYAYSVVRERTVSLDYAPSFAAAQVLTAGVGIRVQPETSLRIGLAASSGGPASVLAGHVEWSPFGAGDANASLEGSPQRIVGLLDGARLPPYVRLDVGLRRTFIVHVFGRSAGITGTASLTNLFDRSNAFGLALDARNGTLEMLRYPPRSAVLGIDWTF